MKPQRVFRALGLQGFWPKRQDYRAPGLIFGNPRALDAVENEKPSSVPVRAWEPPSYRCLEKSLTIQSCIHRQIIFFCIFSSPLLCVWLLRLIHISLVFRAQSIKFQSSVVLIRLYFSRMLGSVIFLFLVRCLCYTIVFFYVRYVFPDWHSR